MCVLYKYILIIVLHLDGTFSKKCNGTNVDPHMSFCEVVTVRNVCCGYKECFMYMYAFYVVTYCTYQGVP